MIIKYVHLLGLTVWLGGMIFFSFIGAPAIFKTLSRELAGQVVGAIFPKYYILGYVITALLLATLYLISKGNLAAVKTGMIMLAVAGSLHLFHGTVIGSKARAIKAEMYQQAEGSEERQALRKKFGKLHGVSSALNLVTMILLLAYLWQIPAILKLTT